jgi:hypothetical protein
MIFVDHAHDDNGAERIITAEELGFEPLEYHASMVSPPFPLEGIEERCIYCSELLSDHGCDECGITTQEMLEALGV